jgi:hypothetical protein
MSIFKSFMEGIKQVNTNKKMLLTLYLFNFIFALIITVPLYSFLLSVLGKSLLANDLIQKFDVKLLVEFIPQHIDALKPFWGLIFFVVIVFFVLGSYLSGGIITRFKHAGNDRFLAQFFQGCGAYFLRFFRLMLISLIFYCIVLIISLILWLVIGLMLGSTSLTFIIPGLFLIFLILFTNMLFDYAKIETVVHDRKGMFRTAFKALKFVFRNLGKTLGLYYLIFLLAVILIVILTSIKNIIIPANWSLIIVLFIVQQLIILARLWIRMLFFSGQLQFYNGAAK